MSFITFLLFIKCFKPITINETSFPWNNHDEKVFKSAVTKCLEDPMYSDTPCLKVFYKREERHYAAICGPEQERSW